MQDVSYYWHHLPPQYQPETASLWDDWQWQLANCIEAPHILEGNIDAQSEGINPQADKTSHVYPMRVTPYYLSLAQTWTLKDPIFRQIMPSVEELADSPLPQDGLGETGDSPLPGVIHRYPDRLLVLLTGACATLCRHCFRKRLWRQGASFAAPDPARTLSYISQHDEISEVIFSGGDALLHPQEDLLEWISQVTAVPHVSVVRIASRLPVVLPQRLTKAFCKKLAACAPVWLMTQFNHPAELTPAAAAACRNLVDSGIPVMNQTVLLKGVNDDPDILAPLFQGLVAMRVKPHYLFHGDPVAGTDHFRTGIAHGLDIMKILHRRISGLAIPRFALDLPGGGGKIPLEADFSCGHGFEAIDGGMVLYR